MRAVSVAPEGTLYLELASGRTLFVGKSLVTTPHHHFSASITLNLDAPLLVRPLGEESFRETRCLIAAPNAAHQLETREGLVLNIQVDPETMGFEQLVQRWLGNRRLVLLDERESVELSERVRPLLRANDVSGEAVWSALLNQSGEDAARPRTFDARITRVLAMLKSEHPSAPPAGQLAKRVGMSEGRLIRLFSSEVGVPLRRYVLWLRLRGVSHALLMGRNLTDAAHDAGFADSAHLARVFREMFGIPPSQLLRSPKVALRLILPERELNGPHAVQDNARLRQFSEQLSAPSNRPR